MVIDLEFDDITAIEVFLERLQTLWASVSGSLIQRPRVAIFDVVEDAEC